MNMNALRRLAMVAMVLFAAAATIWAAGGFFGAIFTTLGDGTSVNHNLYESKDLVYLNGGPQNMNSAGLPDGTYYFQVTDPSGKTLLSSDDAVCRQVTVSNGVIAGPAQASIDLGCAHAPGLLNPANGSVPVQLIPYDDTPNQGGEYKVWLIEETANTSVNGHVITFLDSESKTDNFKIRSNNPITNQQFDLSGTKYYDANFNGVEDPSEPPVGGVVIDIFLNGHLPGVDSPDQQVTTGPDGTWTSAPIDDGTDFIVAEEVPGGWIETGPIPDKDGHQWYSGSLSGQNVTNLDFGNIASASVSGQKFYDSNDNGQRDSGEPVLSGFTINIEVTEPDGTVIDDSTTTDATGSYKFGPYPDGSSYTVTETLPATGWTQTTGNPSGIISASLPSPLDSSFSIPDSTGNDIGNIAVGSVGGHKFNDANMNGSHDSGEAYLSGVTIKITFTLPGGTPLSDQTTTDANGAYSFGPYPDGTTFSLTEVVPTGWQETTVDPQSGSISGSGSPTDTTYAVGSPDHDFGNIQLAPLGGHKWYDTNANGTHQTDGTEPGVANFVIQGNVTEPNGTVIPVQATTDATGAYSLGDFPVGSTFSLSEVQKTGWVETAPTNNTDSGTIPVEGSQNNDFLNYNKAGDIGGLTLGFWSNKNGAIVLTGLAGGPTKTSVGTWPTYATFLSGLNLVDGKGNAFNPTGDYNGLVSFQSWLTGASGTNAANMLSAQLATTELDTTSALQNGMKPYKGGLLATALVPAPSLVNNPTGTIAVVHNAAWPVGWYSIQSIMDAANAQLGAPGGNLTVNASNLRTWETTLQTVLNQINNSQLPFVNPP